MDWFHLYAPGSGKPFFLLAVAGSYWFICFICDLGHDESMQRFESNGILLEIKKVFRSYGTLWYASARAIACAGRVP